jgi:hypothetical protein
MNKMKIGTIIVVLIAAVTVSLSVPAFAQGPEHFTRNTGWDNNRGTEVLVGSFLGAFLAYTIQNNQHHDRDYYYSDRDRDRYSEWDRDHRYNGPNHRRYENRRYSQYDRNHRHGPPPWDHDRDR